ncbi:MAG: winged helix-turn-helix domain-containing protein [Eubacteriales bacterium]|nr:winged helix-turn-helix domain-containing protein [Eubacteriales bacterium]
MIFCVEDDDSIRELMLYVLRSSDFEAQGFADGAGLMEALESTTPRLILLDIMLPGGMDGIEILKNLRAAPATAAIPVILASAKGTEYDKIKGLDLGADDYLAKPFGMMEMVSRVRAVLRRTAPGKGDALVIGGLSVDPVSHIVRADGEPVELTLKEFELLQLFMEHPGRVFSRDQLLHRIWNTDYAGETRTVDVHIGTLRTKLGACGSYIRTVRGVGYRMEERL